MRAGSPVSLMTLVDPSLHAQELILHIQFDKDGSQEKIRMKAMDPQDAADISKPYQAWTTVYTPAKTGLYWYWFELGTAEACERYGWSDGTDNGPEDDITADAPHAAWENTPFISCDPTTTQAVLTEHPGAWQITVYEPKYADPDWIWGGVFYHVFVDRFAKAGATMHMEGKISRDDWGGMPEWRPNEHGEILNNDFFGGNLAGVREKLPYFEELGVTCLYLSPIFEAYSSHKYDTSDYMKVDPMFGDEAEFTSLCEEAAARGIRVICDGVFSHTGSDSRYFDIYDKYGNGACHHVDSPYRDWFYFEHGSWQSWWGIKTLPRVNKDVPSYQEFIAGPDGVVRHWLRAGASGWRLDVADELPRSFLEKLTAGAKAEKPDALILGEVWEDASNKVAYDERKNYFEGDKLDSVMNYPLRRGIIEYIRSGDAQLLARSMLVIMENYPLRVVHALMNILGTHDTERIITALAGQKLGPDATRKEKAAIQMDESQWAIGIRRLKIAVALQMTLPGVPCIYYGDEAGMEGYADPFNRRCFPWGKENTEIQDWYRRVIAIRRGHDVYREGSYRLLASHEGLYAFERAAVDSQGTGAAGDAAANCERMITATNCGQIQHVLSLQGKWHDLLSDAVFTDDVIILPGQAMILEPADVHA